MKHQLTFLALFFMLIGCKQSTTNQTGNDEIESSASIIIEEDENVEELVNTEELKIKRWFEPTELDTILHFEDFHLVTIKNTDSIQITEYFIEKEVIDSLDRLHDNSHRLALDIENYLLNSNTGFAKRDSMGLHLKMRNNNWKLISLNPNGDEVDDTFEHYFKEFGFYSVRTQWGEGNGYKLISDEDGEVTDLFGRPYFSQNGEYVISVNWDIEAGYSWNGFQLFHNIKGKLKKIGHYEPKEWGPYSAKWIDNSTVVLKNRTTEFKNGEINYLDFYSELKINNGG